jgi:signal transduction histidine kinase
MSMFRIALQAMGLLIILPSLMVFYLFRENMSPNKAYALLSILVAACLGYYLLWRILMGVRNILTSLEGVSTGQTEKVTSEGEVLQLKEMASIVNALNRLAEDFRENAAQLDRLIQQFATLAEITEITANVPDITELLRLVLRKAMTATHARIGSVGLLRDDGAGLDIVAHEGWTLTYEGPAPLEGSLAKTIIETGSPMLVEDIEQSPLTQRQNKSEKYMTKSFLIMPLKTKHGTIGIVSLADKATGGVFHSQDQQFLRVLLGQMGYAVENARLLKQARDAASSLRRTIQIQESQLQEAQLKVLQSEKLSALGQLAGGVAHDFNNLLQAILGYASLCRPGAQDSPRLIRNLDQIEKAAQKAANLTAQLLAFGRRQMLRPRNLNLNRVVDGLMKILERVIGEQIQVNVTRRSNGLVYADPHQIEQVLLNLCVNSRDAMPNGGAITIETDDLEVRPAGDERFPGIAPGSYVLLSVMDQGCGMDKETLQRVFEPFFTTKEVGKGTGLGLSTVYGIVSQHNGYVDVKSEPGNGAEFTVVLPMIQVSQRDGHSESQEGGPHRVRSSRGSETVLVAEDEALIRDLSAEILRGAGYEVLVAADGQEAIELFNDHADKITLVVADAVMPKKGGREVYDVVRSSRPKVPMLICSGYSAVDLLELQSDGSNVKILFKPIGPEDLLLEVRNAIDKCT